MKSKIRLAVMGGSGRMGKQVTQLVSLDSDFVQIAAISRSFQSSTTSNVLTKITDVDPSTIDMVIDFSAPECFSSLVKWCGIHQIKLVSGTTGFSKDNLKDLQMASQKTACLWASNMSLGVNLIAEMISYLKTISDYDFQIVEAHHHHKKDKPSGTALFWQDTLKSQIKVKIPDVLSLRGGGIFGVHQLWCMGEEETIKIEHTALNRSVFARGALIAAKWLMQKPLGLYSMKDVLSDLRDLSSL